MNRDDRLPADLVPAHLCSPFPPPRHRGYDARMHDESKTRGGPLYWLKRRSRRFWFSMFLLPVLYVASFGPACWAVSHLHGPPWVLRIAYWPLGKIAWATPPFAFFSISLVQYGALYEDDNNPVARDAIWQF